MTATASTVDGTAEPVPPRALTAALGGVIARNDK